MSDDLVHTDAGELIQPCDGRRARELTDRITSVWSDEFITRGLTPDMKRYILDIAANDPSLRPVLATAARGRLNGWGRPSREATCFTYFIQQDDDGPIKIGSAANVQVRLRQLQTASPQRLHVRAVLPGGEPVERDLHRRFAADRIPGGEWFLPSDQVCEAIRQARLEAGAPA